MPADLSSASPEVQAFCHEIARECEPQVRELQEQHQAMQGAPGAMAAGFSLDYTSLAALAKFALDFTVQAVGQPVETLIVSQRDKIRLIVSESVVEYAEGILNKLRDHPLVMQMRGQGPPQAGHAATGA
jgi:hypothetical protein